MNKFLKYGLAAVVCFQFTGSYGLRLGMHLADALKKGAAAPIADKGTVGGKIASKVAKLPSDGEEAKLYNILVTNDSEVFAGYDRLTDAGKRIIETVVTDLGTQAKDGSEVWKDFFYCMPNPTWIADASGLVTYVNLLGLRYEALVADAKQFTQLPAKAAKVIYGGTQVAAWQMTNLVPDKIAKIVDKIIDTGNAHGGDLKNDDVARLVKYLSLQGYKPAALTYGGSAVFSNVTDGNETASAAALNALNAGSKQDAQQRWAKCILWYATARVTDGQLTNQEQTALYLREKNRGMQNADPTASNEYVQLKKIADSLERKSQALEKWVQAQGYWYDDDDDSIQKSQWL